MDRDEQLKQMLGIPNWHHLSKGNVFDLVEDLDEETQRRIAERFPEVAQLITHAASTLSSLHTATLAANSKSQDDVMSIWKDTGAAIDRELERETEPERRATLLTMRVKAAEMATAADGRNKDLIDRWHLRKTAAVVILVGGAVALLSGRKAIWSKLR